MGKKRIYLSSPTMHSEEQQFVKEAFDTNWIAPLGPNVTAFEEEMAAYAKAGYVTALSSGTAAIHLALKLLNIGPGDVVFVSDLTFAATCNPIVYEGATPVFIDAEPDTWNMSPRALEKAFEKYPKPKAVLCAYLYGTPAKIDEIMAVCEAHHVPYIEDAAESLGSTYKGKHIQKSRKKSVYNAIFNACKRQRGRTYQADAKQNNQLGLYESGNIVNDLLHNFKNPQTVFALFDAPHNPVIIFYQQKYGNCRNREKGADRNYIFCIR